jgi:hypothetical protein
MGLIRYSYWGKGGGAGRQQLIETFTVQHEPRKDWDGSCTR